MRLVSWFCVTLGVEGEGVAYMKLKDVLAVTVYGGVK